MSSTLSINFSDNSSGNSNPGDNYRITGMRRSVGVGAEFDEPTDKTVDINEVSRLSSFEPASQASLSKSANNKASSIPETFKASVEIECAYHLPIVVEKKSKVIEPCTYVTFHPLPNDSENQYNLYEVTNVCMHNCNPRWNWKYNVNLSTEFLTNVSLLI